MKGRGSGEAPERERRAASAPFGIAFRLVGQPGFSVLSGGMFSAAGPRSEARIKLKASHLCLLYSFLAQS